MLDLLSTPLFPDVLVGNEAAASDATPIDTILLAVRRHLGMEIAFAARYVGNEREFTHISSGVPVPSAPGDRENSDQSYCYHALHGSLPELICNARDVDFASCLPITAALPVGAHITVPIRFSDGSLYGSFCCLSRSPNYTLTDRDLATVRAFAELASRQIEQDGRREATRNASRERVEAAIAAREPTIHLQPIHALGTGRTIGAEALARFADAQTRPPNMWFEEAGKVGLGLELELAAVRQALIALPHIPSGQYLSLNVSPETILSGALEPLLRSVAARSVVLEITEHKQVEDYEQLTRRLDGLRPFARIAIDDVGAGYAGLQHIIAFKPDILKLDISLTRDIHVDAAKRALTGAMVSFASSMSSVIVAEGVEVDDERRVLQELGVEYGQGWLFSRAMPVVAAHQMMIGARFEAPAQEVAEAAKPVVLRRTQLQTR